MDEVRLHVEETLGSILQLSVTYRSIQSATPKDAPEFRPLPEYLQESIEYDQVHHWWMDGRKRAYRTQPRLFRDSDRWDMPHRTFDGKRSHEARYQEPDGRMHKLLRSPGMSLRFKDHLPDSWIGIRMNGTEVSLLDLLGHPDTSLTGWESANGPECVKVHVETASCSGTPGEFDIWLDPAHDWLPARMAWAFRYSESNGDTRVVRSRQEVTQFSQRPDGLTGDGRWFPKTLFVVE